jgi:hypothetical protein
MVIALEAQDAVTPAGSPVAVPMPVAPVVVWVIAVKAVFTHSDGVEEAVPAVFSGDTVMVPVADTLPQPPVRGMV